MTHEGAHFRCGIGLVFVTNVLELDFFIVVSGMILFHVAESKISYIVFIMMLAIVMTG